jgi:hypothetical protein
MMDRRILSPEELNRIQKAIAFKDLTSAEILMEVYDHYLSHLQGFSEEEFSQELFELEQKFTYGYCHALQATLNKNAKSDIGKTQWMVIKKYFCASRWLFLVGILVIVFYVSTNARGKEELAILLLSPLILLVIGNIAFSYQNFKKLKPIKRTFKGIGFPIYSSLARPISERMYLPVLMAQVIVFVPKIAFPDLGYPPFLSAVAGIITVLLTLYTISLLEVWKIKSKTALI